MLAGLAISTSAVCGVKPTLTVTGADVASA
jgi:hypothetical protein